MPIKLLIILLGFTWLNPCVAEDDFDGSFKDTELAKLYRDVPNYGLLGRPQTKIQFGFKLKLFSTINLYLSYSQLILWDFFSESSPFTDVNYHPSLFHRFYLNSYRTSALDVIAYEHESNGQSGGQSRSWDRSGVRFYQTLQLGTETHGTFSLRAWFPYHLDTTNRDLIRFRGVSELTLSVSGFLGPSLALSELILRVYPAGSTRINPLQGAQELTLMLRRTSGGLLANMVFQIFHGYAEGLLDYRQSVLGIRGGIGF